MKSIILALALCCVLFSPAEARRQRGYAAHSECNVTMPCIGVETSQRGERMVRAMGGFGTATKTYRPRHSAVRQQRVRYAALHPVRQRAHHYQPRRHAPRAVIMAATPRQAVATVDFVAVKSGIGPRPGRWCGWFMQHDTGVTSAATGLNLNRAIEWRRVGQPTTPQIGAIVVWSHHVGRIVGGGPGAWVVRSGNDGQGQVRERVRADLGRAVAFRTI